MDKSKSVSRVSIDTIIQDSPMNQDYLDNKQTKKRSPVFVPFNQITSHLSSSSLSNSKEYESLRENQLANLKNKKSSDNIF